MCVSVGGGGGGGRRGGACVRVCVHVYIVTVKYFSCI